METSELVQQIIHKEWDFFQQTHNAGGRASCQNDPDTFRIMRASQFCCWSDEILQSYDKGLDAALAEGRNPVTEKYAYMMRSTHPEEFARIEAMLPPISAAKHELIEYLVSVNMAWEEECEKQFPHIRSCGRSLYSTQDSAVSTSFETYLRGELSTYAEETLTLLKKHTEQCLADKINLARKNLECMVHSYGYPSIEELEMRKARLAACKN